MNTPGFLVGCVRSLAVLSFLNGLSSLPLMPSLFQGNDQPFTLANVGIYWILAGVLWVYSSETVHHLFRTPVHAGLKCASLGYLVLAAPEGITNFAFWSLRATESDKDNPIAFLTSNNLWTSQATCIASVLAAIVFVLAPQIGRFLEDWWKMSELRKEIESE